MKIFPALQSFKAVTMDTGVSVVDLPYGVYEIDGAVVPVGYNTQTLVQDVTNIKRVEDVVGEILHYQALEGSVVKDPILSVEEFNKLVEDTYRICEDNDWDEDSDEPIFKDIDTEIEYLKLTKIQNSYRPVRAETTQRMVPVEIEVIGVAVDTGSKFIQTPFTYGQVSWGSNGVFRVDASGIARDEFNRAKEKYPEAKFENSTHSNIRYAQVNGKYMFSDTEEGIRDNQFRVFTDLAEAQAYEQSIRENISNKIRHHVDPVVITQKTITSLGLMNDLKTIQNIARDVDVRVKSEREYSRAMSKLRELIEKVNQVK